MEREHTTNVAETIGNLILNGYSIHHAMCDECGESRTYSHIIFKRRYAFYNEDAKLKGFDEFVSLNTNNGDIYISQREIGSEENDSSN